MRPFHLGWRRNKSKIWRWREGIAQRLRGQFATALHRVAVRFHANRHTRNPARRRLEAGAIGLVGHGIALTAPRQAGKPCDQRRFRQALQIDDRVVGIDLQFRFETAPLPAQHRRQRRLAPAPQLAGNHPTQAAAGQQQGLKQRRK